MTTRVNLPPGNSGFTMQDGTNYSAKPGTHVDVADEHAPFIRRQVGGDAGLVGHASARMFLGTKNGRWCNPCRRLWNCWNATCPKCGGETIPESEMPARTRGDLPSGCPPVRV